MQIQNFLKSAYLYNPTGHTAPLHPGQTVIISNTNRLFFSPYLDCVIPLPSLGWQTLAILFKTSYEKSSKDMPCQHQSTRQNQHRFALKMKLQNPRIRLFIGVFVAKI